MPRPPENSVRVLAIDPSPRGFGFAVLEGSTQLIDWGIAVVYSKSTEELRVRVEALVDRYRPACIVVESIPDDPRRARTLARLRTIADYARSRRLSVHAVSRVQVRHTFAATGATRHEIARALASMFPELTPRLPRKRTAWSSDDERMNIFDAVALAMVALGEARH